jgi:hypothetical protein
MEWRNLYAGYFDFAMIRCLAIAGIGEGKPTDLEEENTIWPTPTLTTHTESRNPGTHA